MKELIPINEENGQRLVAASDLHAFLEVNTPLRKWIERMFEYGFEEGKDYVRADKKVRGNKEAKDYALTIDMAKEISMLQRTDKGKEARQYFIECEKRLIKPMSPAEIIHYQSGLLVNHEQRLNAFEQKINELEAKSITRPEYYSIAGFASVRRVKISLNEAARLGKAASKICNDEGHTIDQVHDVRYGRVGSYPKEVLDRVFQDHGK